MRWGHIAVAVLGVGVLLAAAARPVSHALVAPAWSEQAAGPGPCSKPKVYVKVAFYAGTEAKLNRDYPTPAKSNEQWLDYLSERAAQWLNAMGGEGVEIIPDERKVFTEDRPETPDPERQLQPFCAW